MCAQVGAVCGRSGREIRELLFDSGLQGDFERGLLSEREFHQTFQQLLNQKVDFTALRDAAADIFQLNTPMVPILDALKARGNRLVLLSNTSITHFEFIRDNFDLLGRFDDYVVSYRVGALKPETAIFEAALAAIQCEPAECFYTDDIPDYVARGRGFGLQADVFTDAASLLERLQQLGVRLDGES